MKFKKRNRRRRSARQLIKHWIKPILLITLIALIAWGWKHYNPTNLLKVALNWSIDHPELVSQTTLEQQIKPLVVELHQLDLPNIKQTLEQQPWVLTAQVKRSLLDVIDIHITTHQVATHWQNIDCTPPKATNCQGYITQQGELIKPTNLFYHQSESAESAESAENFIELRSADKTENAKSLYA
ncbi:MAG: FtsQ-type POTRA domain-containing protein, partial [Candidatus Thioglobus sp.]|uniref:cell division protein FtsQ/DivIB n=1 Tax=Candidatus Thioglobus sp. TaxID=2026721 RepID=UPI002620B9FB